MGHEKHTTTLHFTNKDLILQLPNENFKDAMDYFQFLLQTTGIDGYDAIFAALEVKPSQGSPGTDIIKLKTVNDLNTLLDCLIDVKLITTEQATAVSPFFKSIQTDNKNTL